MARLLLATDSLEPSGVGEHMLALAEGLRDGFEIVVAAPEHARGDLLGRASKRGFGVAALTGDDAAFMATQAFDIAHIHAGIGWEGLELVETASKAGIHTVLRTEHLPDVITDPAQRSAHLRSLNHIMGLICVSAAAAASFVAAGVPAAMIHVVRNGILQKEPRQARAETRRNLGIAPNTPLAVTVARLTEQKNHLALLAALPGIMAAQPDFKLALVGSGPLEDELRAAAAPWGEAVLFLGHRQDVPDLLAAADLFVLPSRFEGLPLSLIEAMAAGLPAVATAIGGNDEVVDSGVTGILAQPDRLADAVTELLADSATAAAMGRAARLKFETDFSHSRMCRDTRDVYARIRQDAGNQGRTVS